MSPRRCRSAVKNCERCGIPTFTLTMSIFNSQMICLECDKQERAHTLHAAAKEAELDAIRQGEMNFPGIGLPTDLADDRK